MLLEIKNLTKVYETDAGPITVVRDFCLEVAEHEFLCLIGHSGCGKTTLLSMVAGLLPATSGEILMEGLPITGPGPDRGVLFQSCPLLPHLTVVENVLLGVEQVSHATRKKCAELAVYFLGCVGLVKDLHCYPEQLSAGMRKRASLAAALALRPKLLILDEPFGLLDTWTRLDLQRALLCLRAECNFTTLMVTHDIDEALSLADRVVVMTKGPDARVGHIAKVPFSLPRNQGSLLERPEYQRLYGQLASHLG